MEWGTQVSAARRSLYPMLPHLGAGHLRRAAGPDELIRGNIRDRHDHVAIALFLTDHLMGRGRGHSVFKCRAKNNGNNILHKLADGFRNIKKLLYWVKFFKYKVH